MRRNDGQSATVIATTPRVVPMARIVRSDPVGEKPASALLEPATMPKVTNVAIDTTLFRIGANIGAAKRRCELRSPVATAPMP